MIRFLLSICLCLPLLAADSYIIDTLTFPEDMPPEVGGLEFASDGALYMALRRGDVMVATPSDDPTAFVWKRFATGFHNACGIHVVKPGHVVIGQMAELTEVIDTDGDGSADVYNSLSTDFGLSGNYHETMDIASDGAGGYYLAPGTASHNGPTFATPRGEYSKIGRTGRNYSAVKWRGWVLHWTPDGGIKPVSSGYRMHNGIERDPDGNLWCGDNQGDWRAVTPLYHITQDSFMGHPSALAWDERFASFGNHLYLPRILMDDLWKKPSFHIPHGMVRSAGEPVFDTTDGAFGPFAGQMFVPDQSGESLLRCMPEWVDGAYQGAALQFWSRDGLKRGGNRLAFSPDGTTLYIGQTGRGWGKLSEGIQRIRYTGELPFTVQMCSLSHTGFTLTFTKPVKAADLEARRFAIERYRYRYSHSYGSPEQDKAAVEIRSIRVDEADPRIVHLELAELIPNYNYKLTMIVSAADGRGEFANRDIIYTLNRLRRPEATHAVTVEPDADERLHIKVDGELFTTLHLKGFDRPILYPILTGKGQGMTRDWPLAKAPRSGEQHDHPHHEALFIGHEQVNETDNWHIDRPACGRISHAKLLETRSGEDRALVRTLNLWHDNAGEVIGSDTREWSFGLANGQRYIDLELNVHASHGELNFAEKKDGFVGLRTHPHLRLTAKPKGGVPEVFGQAANSEGVVGKDIWGKKANWVHYFGQVEGSDAGIAFMAHPDNLRSPTWWHARDYGLVAANPFGPVANTGDGAYLLPAGQTLTLRYRLVFHDQSGEAAAIDQHYADYIAQPLVPRTVIAPIPGQPAPAIKVVPPKNVIPRGGALKGASLKRNGKAANAPELKANGLVEGQLVFGDREYLFASVPDALRGADLLRTFNDDKKASRRVAYELELSAPGTLLVLLDTRFGSPLEWMQEAGFKKSKEIVQTNSDFAFAVYRKTVEAGTHALGDQSNNSFYSIAVLKK